MNRREAFGGVAAGLQWILDQTGRQQFVETRRAQGGSGPARPWDIAVPPGLTIDQTEIEPGASVVHLRLTLDRDPFMTVRVLLTVVPGHRHGFDAADGVETDVPFLATWSPGDDLVQYVSVPVPTGESRPGWRFRIAAPASFRQSGWSGADRGRHVDVVVAASPSPPNRLPGTLPRQRALHSLRTGQASFAQEMSRMQWSRTGRARGGKAVWRTSLQYGDGPANANEKGLYANAETYPGSNPHQLVKAADGRTILRLHTRRYDAPVRELDMEGRPRPRSFPFQAAWLSGQTLEGLCHETGLWELEFTSPDRYGAWAAHWMMGVRDGRTVWPPEIDVFEHFNGVYGPWNADRDTSTALHYGEFGQGRRGACGATVDLTRIGFPQSFNLTNAVHKSQCLISRDFITIFMDGREIVQFRHILKPVSPGDTRLFHPVISVAVAPERADDPYNERSGDMLVYGYNYYPLDQVSLHPGPEASVPPDDAAAAV